MNERSIGQHRPKAEHRVEALAAAGIVGTWEHDHRQGTYRFCRGAAELLAGDPDLAWQDLMPDRALANVCTDDMSWLRNQLQSFADVPGVYIREYRVRSGEHGVRRVLTRGRNYLGPTGGPGHSLGVILDITEIEADGRDRFATEDDALNSAAEHGVAAYEAIQASGASGLLAPARALLMAIGREIARGLSRKDRRPH